MPETIANFLFECVGFVLTSDTIGILGLCIQILVEIDIFIRSVSIIFNVRRRTITDIKNDYKLSKRYQSNPKSKRNRRIWTSVMLFHNPKYNKYTNKRHI